MPINLPNGANVEEIVLPNGSQASEVIGPDGSTVWERVAIPDDEVYLHDDWGDDKLQDRDDSVTTMHNGVESVYRPEWQEVDGEGFPSVAEQTLTIDRGEYMVTEINLNFDEEITWEIDSFRSGGATFNENDQTNVALFGSSDTIVTGDDPFSGSLHQGYALQHSSADDDSIVFYEIDSNGNGSRLIDWSSGGSAQSTEDIKVVRKSDGTWELYVNGSFEGDASDSTHTVAEYIAVGSRDNAEHDSIAEIAELKVS